MNRTRIIGTAALAGFLFSIPAANWWLTKHGMWDVPHLGMVPSAVWVVAISFVLRDLAQITLGRTWAWAAIAIGTALSWWLASPALAVASGAAFLWSESTDAVIFTPLANKGRFALGVAISGVAASAVDSAIFMRLAFDSWEWWPLFVAKSFFVLAATPVAWAVRRVFLIRTITVGRWVATDTPERWTKPTMDNWR